MSFSRNKKDNGAEAFVTIEIRRFRSRYLFSNLKIEQKNRIVVEGNNCFQVGTDSTIKSVKTSRINEAGASVMRC